MGIPNVLGTPPSSRDPCNEEIPTDDKTTTEPFVETRRYTYFRIKLGAERAALDR